MVDRIAAFLSLDQPTMGKETRLWTLNDVWAVTSVMASAGVLKHGAKTAIDNAFDMAEVKGDYGLGGLPGADPAGQLAHWKKELAEWFEPQALDQILDMFGGRWQTDNGQTVAENPATLHNLLDWWLGKLAGNKRPQAEFPARVVARNGLKAALTMPKLFVGTGHSFKGSEADACFVFPDLSPAGFEEWDKKGEGRDSVVRLYYVMMTRAKESLYLCSPGSQRSVPIQRLAEPN
jgi:hypothetical protein